MSTPARSRPFVRAAHYFGDGWPLDSLLVMRSGEVRRDLRTLRRLGFNTIILVVPWQGYQTGQEPPAYDRVYEEQLRLVLREVQAQGLRALLRVSYVHQVMRHPAIGSVHMAQRLLTSPVYEAAWFDYLQRVADLCAEFSIETGLFVSWEELWHAFRYWQLRGEEERRNLARETGFLDFLAAQGVEGIDTIPEREDPAHRHYHAFINARIRACFDAARAAVPTLGVEYRVDKDPVTEPGGVEWLDNEAFIDWEPARYSYWAPFMGAENVGETLKAKQALASLGYMLDATSDDGRASGQVIEQFNYIDDTAQYAGQHAEIARGQLSRFLKGAASLLAERSGGYGLWAPRDYRCNILYNSAFIAQARGWDVDKGSALDPCGIDLAGGGRLTQRIRAGIPWVPRMHPFDEIKLEVRYAGGWTWQAPRLRARFNEHTWVDLKRTGPGRLAARLPLVFDTIRTRGIHFELENQGMPLRLERLFLFHLVYRVGVQTVDGRAGAHAREIRRFNRRLASLRSDGPQAAAR